MSTYTRVPGILLVAAALAAAALAATGVGLVALWSAGLLAVVLGLARRLPPALSLSIGIGVFFSIELLLLLVAPLLALGMTVVHVAVWGVLSLAVGAWSAARPAAPPLDRSDVPLALAASAGAIVLLAVFAAARVVSGAQTLAWAMHGDTVNAMGFARRMRVDGGIDLASTPQPTPLPFAMSAANMEGGRSALPGTMLLEHDVARTAEVWLFVLVLGCLLVGAIVARVMRTAALRWALPVVALSTTLPLAWYVLGVQIRFGFMNSAFAVALLLAAWLVYVGGTGRPAPVLLGLFTIALALLAVWSPLVVCIAGLGLVTLVRDRRLMRASRPAELVVTALPAVGFLVYAALVTVPGFLRESQALGSDGGFPPIGPASIFVVTALVLLAAAVAAQSGRYRTAFGVIAVVAGFALGLGYLLSQRLDAGFGWGYYPAKFAWTTSILLLVILMSLAVQLLHAGRQAPAWKGLTVASIGAVMVALLWGPATPSEQVPLRSILAGSNDERAAGIVFDLVGAGDGKDVLWRTGVGDFLPNTWLLQIDKAPDDPVKIYATVGALGTDQMCAVIGMMGPETVVHTSDPAARPELEATCPDARYTLIEGEY